MNREKLCEELKDKSRNKILDKIEQSISEEYEIIKKRGNVIFEICERR